MSAPNTRPGRAAKGAERFHAEVCGLTCNSFTGPGWRTILGYASERERMRIYALLCVCFNPLVKTMRRSVRFRRSRFVRDDGTIVPLALDRVINVFTRFPELTKVAINLNGALAGDWANETRVPIVLQLCTLTRLTSLRLSGNRLTGLPVEIGLLTALRTLVLKNNNVMLLPAAIGYLTALRTLDLGNTNLQGLPDEIGDLTQLTSLHLHCNRIRALPESLGNLTALKRLELISNQIRRLPASIGRLTALRYLSLASEHLEELPDTIVLLTSIETLTIRRHRYGFMRRPQTVVVQNWLMGLLGAANERAAWRLAPVEVPEAAAADAARDADYAAANASASDSSEEDCDDSSDLADAIGEDEAEYHLRLRFRHYHQRMRRRRLRNEAVASGGSEAIFTQEIVDARQIRHRVGYEPSFGEEDIRRRRRRNRRTQPDVSARSTVRDAAAHPRDRGASGDWARHSSAEERRPSQIPRGHNADAAGSSSGAQQAQVRARAGREERRQREAAHALGDARLRMFLQAPPHDHEGAMFADSDAIYAHTVATREAAQSGGGRSERHAEGPDADEDPEHTSRASATTTTAPFFVPVHEFLT